MICACCTANLAIALGSGNIREWCSAIPLHDVAAARRLQAGSGGRGEKKIPSSRVQVMVQAALEHAGLLTVGFALRCGQDAAARRAGVFRGGWRAAHGTHAAAPEYGVLQRARWVVPSCLPVQQRPPSPALFKATAFVFCTRVLNVSAQPIPMSSTRTCGAWCWLVALCGCEL